MRWIVVCAVIFLALHCERDKEVIVVSPPCNVDSVKCTDEGDATDPDERHDNKLKNRGIAPQEHFDLDFKDFVHARKENFSERDGIEISGYVTDIWPGPAESANCNSDSDSDHDVHLAISKDKDHTEGKDVIYVEVTPKWKKLKGWSLENLRKECLHRYITVGGWFYWDGAHKAEAFSENPTAKEWFRGSCAEIHPVTFIQSHERGAWISPMPGMHIQPFHLRDISMWNK